MLQTNTVVSRLLSLVLVSCMFAVVFIGCGMDRSANGMESGQSVYKIEDTNPEGKKEITFWMKKGLVEDTNRIIVQRGKDFAAKYNVKVNVEIIPYEDLIPKWAEAIESGNTPDVSFLGYQEVGRFYEKGALADLSPLYKKIEEQNGAFYPILKNAVTFQGKQYGIPFWAETTVMYYRKDILAAAGFNRPPQTWDEYRRVAKATTEPEKGVYGAGIGYGKSNSDAEWFTRSVLWSFGGFEVGADGKTITVDSPESVAAVRLISNMFLVDKSTPPSSIGWDDSGNNKAYLSGEAVTVFNSGSIANKAKTDNPDLYKNTGIAPLPRGPEGRFVPGIENTLGIFENSKNPELAQMLVEYLMDKAWYSSWIDNSAPLLCPVYSGLEGNPIWQDPMNKPFIQSIKDFTFLGYKGDFSSAAGKVYDLRLVNDTMQDIIVSRMAPEKSMEDLQAKIEQIYKK
ncbi:carbohydrate ABC transporter substrate-binding protein (CUT1 family) [Anaerobacterium chartisolvens]|uniref:Carbohydrate ABC transporter substrate-binding protein (CUT1 family) n=1 Tax=Anaerobacterium chartisolvens TaxID=1297424 RepID=A0A369AK54_9FIRM|nr:sugar ABC transporter substrate-binding protein [Anaerobacterium chartisolvens]RCX08666.1 carbohydrate ABC transporter substrate-binding protein (CUT1 family) [Anaerobacterium chartisolvens]